MSAKIAFSFALVSYRKPRQWRAEEISRFVGVDTEAYTTGRPFLFCTSDGAAFGPESVPRAFFSPEYEGTDFVCYHLQYDSGALLCALNPAALMALWEKGEVTFRGYRYLYIEHKFLEIRRGRERRRFWDIAQYYEMSLDRAAQKYLDGQTKSAIETKRFTPEYVKKNRDRLIAYCIQDSKLTAALAEFFKAKLRDFGVSCTRLYSSASLSYDYFSARGPIVNVWPYWTKTPDVLRAACEAYQGGKFEISARGRFAGIEYDIVSAYPYEIAALVDLRMSRTERIGVYRPDATYSFLRCWIKNRTPAPMPHSVKIDNVQIFPVGEFYGTLTKNEYEYMTRHGIDITVLDAWHIHADRTRFPYRERVLELYKMKEYYKGKDEALYNVSKKMLNGFYGKFLQLVSLPSGKLRAGAGWNPVYGAVITANTRLRVCEYQRRFPRDCIAVHTDSVIMRAPLPDAELSADLGGLKKECSGDGVIVMCGMYDIGEKTKYRGFEFRKNLSWRELLTDNLGAREITYPQTRVISWTQAVAWGRPELINVFQEFPKIISLNADTKRQWPRTIRARDLLARLDFSTPRTIIQRKGDNPYVGQT
jgi:hypothetical protein